MDIDRIAGAALAILDSDTFRQSDWTDGHGGRDWGIPPDDAGDVARISVWFGLTEAQGRALCDPFPQDCPAPDRETAAQALLDLMVYGECDWHEAGVQRAFLGAGAGASIRAHLLEVRDAMRPGYVLSFV